MTKAPAALAVILALAAPGAAQPPPEVARTVAAFDGRWVLDTRVGFDGKELRAKLSFDCRKIALGKAVSCTMKGTIPGFPPEDNAFLIGYDAAGKVVRFMAMTTGGEVHDHHCGWQDDRTLACAPLAYTTPEGTAASEELSFAWPDARSLRMSVVMTVGGATVTLDAAGRRR